MPRVFLRPHVRRAFAYAAAFACAGLAVLLLQLLRVTWDSNVVWLTFMAAVLATGAIGGAGPALLAAVLGVVAADYFFLPAPGTFKLPYTTHDAIALTIFICASALAASLSRVTRRALLQKARADAAVAQIESAAQRRNLLLQLTTRTLAGGSLEAVCREAATIAARALDVERCAILEKSRDDGALVIACAVGFNAGTVEGLTIPADVDTQVGYALHTHNPVVVRDVESESRFGVPAILRAHGVRSGIAAGIAAGGRAYGVVVAYSAQPRQYAEDAEQFVSGVAAALAGMYDRKRIDVERADLAARDTAHRSAAAVASKRAAFLAQTSTVLDAALEPEATLVSLAHLAVPAIADCAIVDVVLDDGNVRRVEVIDIDPTRRDVAHAVRRQPPNLRSESPFSRAIRTGQSILLAEVPERTDGSLDPEHARLMSTLQCHSLLLIPLVARGQTLGLVTLASREATRRYEAADLAVAQELAGRAAIALDNARLHREAELASRAKDQFLATVSHELRTPITAVLGWATMLRDHGGDPARVQYACEAIERSARAQAQLLEQLLDVSRAISGKLEMNLAPAHLGGIIEAAIDAVRPDADARKVKIAPRLDRAIPLLLADPERLQQVVTNLVSNAVKFSRDGGQVDVELRRDEGYAEIIVRDRGVGIAREFLPYVFERFRQAETAGTANPGLGLGLSIARDIVERHGGTVMADSAGEGKGATFTVRLPLRAIAPTAVGA
jgi:signal transduction histidine kinase